MKSKIVASLFAVSGLLGGVVAGCGGGGTTPPPTGGPTGTNHSLTAMNKLTLPTLGSQYAIDLNGDGTVDNQLGKIIGAVVAINLMPQSAVDASVASGAILVLLDEQSTDATQQKATDAGIKLQSGIMPATPPDYTADPTFTVDTTIPAAQFVGDIASGTFTSVLPYQQTTPISFTLNLALVQGQGVIPLPVIGGYISYTDNGSSITGTINGAVKETDVDNTIIPAVAKLLTAQLMADPTSTQLKGFDTNGDGIISASEVMNNPIISAVIKADVQMFQNNVYMPSKANTTPDSLSLGISFTATKAMF